MFRLLIGLCAVALAFLLTAAPAHATLPCDPQPSLPQPKYVFPKQPEDARVKDPWFRYDQQLQKLQAAVASLRGRDKHIFEHVGRIKTGMTKQKVIEILGEPSRRQKHEWYYAISPLSWWIDETVKVKGYVIVFQDGRVKQVKTDGARYYRRPDDR